MKTVVVGGTLAVLYSCVRQIVLPNKFTATNAGCEAPSFSPAEGDVRLVPLKGTAAPTAVCDDVHFGGVELFREGAWGRICVGRSGGEEDKFTLDAQVVCRQLGLPFGTVMDAADFDFFSSAYYTDPLPTVWATQVLLYLASLPVS